MKTWKIFKFFIFTAFIFLAIWQFYPYLSDFSKLYKYRYSFNYFWIIIAALFQITQYISEGYFIRKLLKIFNFNVNIKNSIKIAALDVFAIRILPLGYFGPLAAFIYFYRKLGVSTQAIIYLNLLLSIVSGVILVLLFLLSSVMLKNSTFPFAINLHLIETVIILALLLLVLIILALRNSKFLKNIHSLLKKYPWYAKLEINKNNLQSLKTLFFKQKEELLLFSILKNLIYYLCDLVILSSCFLAFNTLISPPLIVFAYIVALIAGTLSLLPGGLGATDATLGIIFLSANVNPLVTVGFILLYRVVTFLFPVPLGGIAYLSLRKEIKNINRIN